MDETKLTLSEIDVKTCSIEDIDNEIHRLELLHEEYYNLEQSLKIWINSIYGALGSPWFECYNVSLAEATTLQGQDLIKYANSVLDDYFINFWHLDKKLHEAMGLTYVNKLSIKSTVIYNDTDSVVGSTLLDIDGKSISIEKLYNDCVINGSAGTTSVGHESVLCKGKVLNYSPNSQSLYHAPIKRVIRHKVSKAKWSLKTKSGKEIVMTNDHSMIVFRDGKQLTVKPCEILISDKILCKGADVKIGKFNLIKYYFDEIESCEQVGMFEDEWVYDIEVDDDTHTFIANDILVHNSTYVTLGDVFNSCDWKGTAVDFVLTMKKLRLSGYLKQKFEEYASKYNTTNIQDLELEKISHSALMVAKKKYVLDLAWKDPGVYFKPQEKVKPVGVEIVQGSTPPFSRKALKTMINMMFAQQKNLKYADVVQKLKAMKKDFVLRDPDEISKTQAIGDYEKFILEDRNEIRLAPKTPINVRSAAVYNHTLINSKLKSKYNLIKTGDKLKYYYAKNDEGVFGFLPGNFPYEIAPEIDYDKQFSTVMVEPFNRFMTSAGFNSIPGSLVYAAALF